MSKKKNKFKKKHQSKQNISPSPAKTENFVNKTTETQDNNIENFDKSNDLDAKTDSVIYTDNQYSHVKKDVKKILIMILLMILFLIGVYILNQNTTVLTEFGDWIYKILNIQTS